MFGYVTIRKPEMKIKDYELYHGFYCGLCQELKERYGFLGQITLTYDMTFLVILLSSLYEEPVQEEKKHCIVHPAKKHTFLRTAATKYGADMNVVLSYFHFEDDWIDERNVKAATGMIAYRKMFQALQRKYPKQCHSIRRHLKKLHDLEQRNCQDVQEVAKCFGYLMSALVQYRQDVFRKELKNLGYHLGKFIYIMDAYDDLEKDCKNNQYNALKRLSREADFEALVERLLHKEMVAVSVAFEKLPCLRYVDILRNIIYAGVWNRFDHLHNQQKEDKIKQIGGK